jgi:DNA-binding CsgD family transcriptional regulator
MSSFTAKRSALSEHFSAEQSPWSDEPHSRQARAVGRERELAELELALLGAELERPPVVVVHGRRGIGKTTLAAAAAQRAAAHGVEVVWTAGGSLPEISPGTLVILDDACDIPEESLRRLTDVVRQSPRTRLLVLCPGARYRLAPAIARWLDELEELRGCRFLMLRPLGPQATDTLVRAGLGDRARPALVASVSERAAGDPSLIKEFTHVLRRDPGHDVRDEIPDTVLGVVGLRLATLGGDDRRITELAAAFSGPFALEWLAAAAEVSEEAALTALGAAEDAGLVRVETDRFELSAPAVRDAVRALAFRGNGQRVHRRVAEALAALPPDSQPDTAAETARQYHASRRLPGADRGVEPAMRAARQALAASSPLRAVELLELGIELCRSDQAALQARLTGALARAWASALCHPEATAALERACRQLQIAGAPGDQLADLVIEVAGALPLPIIWFDAAAVRRIRALIGPLDERREERLNFALRARQWESSDPARLYERLVRAGTTRDAGQRTAGLFQAAIETIEILVDPALAAPLLQQTSDHASRIGSSSARSLVCALQAVAAGRRGELQRAAELAETAVNLQADGDGGPSEPSLAQLILTLTQMQMQPDWERLAALIWRRAAGHWSAYYAPSLIACAALARAQADDTTGARLALLDVITALERAEPHESFANAALGPAVETAWLMGDRRLGERLRPIARRLIAGGAGDFYMSQQDLTSARLELLAGRFDEARSAFDRAAVALDRAGERVLRARLDLEHGEALAQRGDPLARQLRADAARRFEQLGLALPTQPQGPQTGSPGGPDGLTKRQLEVLLLLAEGLTSQQIADRLVVSVNTVNRHVSDAYRKIGVSNRVGAAAYVARHGLAR